MSTLLATYSDKEPVSQITTAILSDSQGSVRPKGSFYMRVPYQSLNHVLDQMKNQVQKWKGDQQVRQKAVEITQFIRKDKRTGLPDRRNFGAIAEAVYQWMKNNIQYIRDPHGIELLQSPIKTLEYGYGDCDDQSILAAALLSSLGVPTRFNVVKANPSNPDGFSHVYVQYMDRGQWKGFDPTLHTKAGDELADHQIFGSKQIDLADAQNNCNCKKKAMSSLIKKSNLIQQSPVYDIKSGQIINDELGVVGAGAAITAITKGSAIVGGAKKIVSSIFGGGDQGPKRRGQKRQELATLGFTYENKSGHQDRHYTNIENFDDAGLDNIGRAVNEYGVDIVRELHNNAAFNQDTARNYNTIKQIIERNLPETVPAAAGSSTPISRAGLDLNLKDPKVMIGGVLAVSALVGTFIALKKNQVKAKK